MSQKHDFKSNLECSIAPWTLPCEKIPISVKLSKNVNFDKIRITLPTNFKFDDFINIGSVDFLDNIAEIDELIKTKSSNTPLYFGIIISSKDIPKELKTLENITIELIENNEIKQEKVLHARIFRPLLKIIDIDDEIILNDDCENYEIPMNIKYMGFGDINLKIESKIKGEIKGQIISKNETIINEMLKRMLEYHNNLKIGKKENKNKGIHLEDEVIHELAEQIENKILSGDLSGLSNLNKNDIESLEQIYSDVEFKNSFLNVVYTHVEDIFIGILSELLETHPTDNVKLLNSKTNIEIKIKSNVTQITTYIYYKDSIGNEYDPIEIPMKIIDNRRDKTQHNINVPIRIKKLKEEPFFNVAEMNIEEDN